ncbi:SRPBCC domain-containing protein [Plantactinospora sp. B6F1]|uniref:SRPBCC domain-containing protein n=1 Tax=Plantactinospora sp. B6F1 TaxID=3158971 RepID=UPI0032D93080
MTRKFEVRWEGGLAASPSQAWDAITARTAGWLWKIEYEPRLGGTERGLSDSGGTVTAWEPHRRFGTRAGTDDEVNELDYRIEPGLVGCHLRFVHRGVFAEDYARNLDACRQHTAFYYHSLGEYLRHFAGRDAAYVSADGPEPSGRDGFATVRRALGLPSEVSAGDRVTLTPAGLPPVEGVVDYATPVFLGVRGADALYRFYGRDAWGWPVGVAHHLFADGVDEAAESAAWQGWLTAALSTPAPSSPAVPTGAVA